MASYYKPYGYQGSLDDHLEDKHENIDHYKSDNTNEKLFSPYCKPYKSQGSPNDHIENKHGNTDHCSSENTDEETLYSEEDNSDKSYVNVPRR